MPVYPKLKGNDGKPFTITIDKFNKGVMTIFDETRLPQAGVINSQNMYLDQDSVWVTRPGSAAYGATLTTPIDGICEFVKYNTNGTTSTYVAVIDNGAFKYSSDGGSWTTVSGATWTTGKPIYFKQINSRLYIGNGTEAMAYYDIAAGTLNTFTALTTPVNPTTAKTGMSGGATTLYYKVTAFNEVGETLASAEKNIASCKARDTWVTGTDYVTVGCDAVTNATGYNWYYSDQTGKEVYLDSTSSNSYIDTGVAVPNPYQETPALDSTGGPKYAFLALSGNRLWGTKDPNQPYRVGWTGTGQYQGAFNPFYGGGYIDLNKGGDERPEYIASFRDGKGTSVATVLTSTPDGGGSTWHVALTTLTVDTLVIVIPQAYQQQGAVGTKSPRGVVEYNNSIYYPSAKGFQTLGSKQSILNVLVTNDISTPIRPSLDGLLKANDSLICGIAHKGRLWWSVSTSGSNNTEIFVLDLERGGVWALPWTIGVKQFCEYTDSSNVVHLLAIPTSGTKLIEFSPNIKGDSGVAFTTSLESGLIHFDPDHATFARVKKAYIEIANPQGSITFNISGNQKSKSFSTVGSITITQSDGGSGFSTDMFSDPEFSDSMNTPTSFSSSSIKKRIMINKLLNNLKWQTTSSSIDSKYNVMQIIITGVLMPTSDPSSWKA